MLAIGSAAPDFEVDLHTGTRVRLSSLLQSTHVVLYFYPKDFTAGCTKEACLFTDQFGEIQKHNAVVLGISGDATERHKEFAGAYRLPYLLGSDPDGSIARAYGALLLGLLRLRITYVIDRHGIIRSAVHHEVRITNHLTSTLSVLKDLP